MTPPAIPPGFIALHSHRAEVLADILTGWLRDHPLGPLESEVVLVQSNGMAEWFKMALAERAGVCAAARVELPSRFLWRTYRQVLGAQNVPPDSPLDKLPMTWRLMALLPHCVGEPVFQPVAGFLRGDEPDRLLQLASRLADLYDQYQIYRPDWLQDWAAGRDVLRQVSGERVLADEQRWQAELWRRVLGTLSDAERAATRPALHARVLAHLRSGQPLASPVARRVSVFGMSHMPSQLLDTLAALAAHSQVMLAVPNPCQYHWGDIMDGREWLQAGRRRHADRAEPLSDLPLDQMHLHAPALLVAWGRQGRDFIRQLDALDDVQAAEQLTQLPRLDFFDDPPGLDATRALVQLQHRIRDLTPTHEPALPLAPHDASVAFRVAHSPVRELEVLHDQLLAWFHAPPGGRAISPREVVVMVPDIEAMAPQIRAVFGQYKRGDARFIPFDIADLGAQAVSPLVHAVQWLLALPQQRARLSELVELLEVPALAARFGIAPEGLPTLMRWMAGSGIRWGLSAEHRSGLGLASCGEDNSALFGLQRMLMGYACGADPMPVQAPGAAPYAEVGGLDAELAGALAHLLQALIDWWQTSGQDATPAQWAERSRALLTALFKPQDDNDRNALAALEQALADWVQASDAAGFAQSVPLAVARSAWLEALRTPQLAQRFRAGGVTFCTLMPMRAIPFQAVCLLGMNDGDYPRRSPRADFDLMGQPGMARPGDRSRRDDDRQLMLEALLSARQVLYVSWSGHSVRDNSEQPPSVLVSQLRDEMDALWGAGTAARLTTAHPLQPFSRAYFDPHSPLHTYAHEWRAAQQTAAQTPDPHPSTQPLPALDAAQGLPQLTVAQLHGFLRRPVAAFFRQRLLVNLQDERFDLPDEELFGLNGLDLYALMDEQLQRLPEELAPEQLPAHLAAAVQGLRRAGALPLAAVGTYEARRLTDELQPLLACGLAQRQVWPQAAPRLDLARAHAAVRLQDSLSGLRLRTQDPATGEPVVQTACIVLRASKVARLSPAGKITPLPEKLIGVWLTQLAAAASGHALHAVVVGRNALLHSAPLAQEVACAQLDTLLDVWAEGMRWPLPLPPVLALRWVPAQLRGKAQDPALRHALADLYEGNGYDQPGEARKDPAMQRVYPDLDALLAGGHFERLAEQVYGPLLAWCQTLRTEPVQGASADEDNEEI